MAVQDVGYCTVREVRRPGVFYNTVFTNMFAIAAIGNLIIANRFLLS